MERRGLLSRLGLLPLLGGVFLSTRADETKKPLKIMFKSAWGSDDPTKAAFAFLHGNALAEAGHTVQIFLLGEAVSLMRSSLAHAVVPVGWPPLIEALSKASANRSMPAAPVLEPGALPKRISPSGERSSAIRRSLYLSSSGLIGLSPNS